MRPRGAFLHFVYMLSRMHGALRRWLCAWAVVLAVKELIELRADRGPNLYLD